MTNSVHRDLVVVRLDNGELQEDVVPQESEPGVTTLEDILGRLVHRRPLTAEDDVEIREAPAQLST